MAIVQNGNDLSTPLLQPGWTINGDGYGLITSTTRYKGDFTVDYVPFVLRGEPHPDPAYSFLKSNKYSITWDTLGIATITMDYVGIDPTFNEGNVTNPNCSGSNGLTAQNITSHINFFTAHPDYSGAIAGAPPYVQDTPNNLAPNVSGQPAYLGLNGACFEKASGGRFIGFVDPSVPSLYGKTQYLAPTTSYSGVIYMKNLADVQALMEELGWSTSERAWASFVLLPEWAPAGTGEVGNKNLLTQVNVEEYGALFKVMYEIRYSPDGWDPAVYARLD